MKILVIVGAILYTAQAWSLFGESRIEPEEGIYIYIVLFQFVWYFVCFVLEKDRVLIYWDVGIFIFFLNSAGRYFEKSLDLFQNGCIHNSRNIELTLVCIFLF